MRNVMHVNTGTGKFVDVAFHAGIDSTDWTWAAIFGDLDNDGFEDAFLPMELKETYRIRIKLSEYRRSYGLLPRIEKNVSRFTEVQGKEPCL